MLVVAVWPCDSNTADGSVAWCRQSRFVARREELVANKGRELPDRQSSLSHGGLAQVLRCHMTASQKNGSLSYLLRTPGIPMCGSLSDVAVPPRVLLFRQEGIGRGRVSVQDSGSQNCTLVVVRSEVMIAISNRRRVTMFRDHPKKLKKINQQPKSQRTEERQCGNVVYVGKKKTFS